MHPARACVHLGPAAGGGSNRREVLVAGPAASEVIDAALLGRLDRSTVLSDPDRIVENLPGGLTNHNLKVTTSAGTFVARLAGRDTDLLAIDRDAEYLNSLSAAASGVAPEVVERVPDAGLLVIRYVEARTLTATDLADPDTLVAVAAACRALHTGPRFVGDFDMFAIQRRYLATVLEHGYRLPPRYREHEPAVRDIQRTLALRPVPTVPCHNDLLAANILAEPTTSGHGRIWLIDYEYGGNNDPCFELGNIWSEAVLPPELLAILVTGYFGRPRPSLVARSRLHGLLSKYGWMLWASISEAVSEVEFDFWSWGLEKYDRAVAEFDGPDLPVLLEACTAAD